MKNKNNVNFLYIVDSFPPTGMQVGIRALELSKRLIQNNIYPIIITQKITKESNLNLELIKQIPKSLIIYRFLSAETNKKSTLYLRNYLFRLYFLLKSVPLLHSKFKRIFKKYKNLKFIYVSGPEFFTHILGYLLKKKFNIPLVVEYRDPWSFNPYIEKHRKFISKKIEIFIEKKILKSADIILTVSTPLMLHLKNYFPFLNDKHIFSIPHGINLLKFQNINKKNSHKIIFTFLGTLYEKRSIIPFLKIISELKKESFFRDFNLIIKIFGKYDEKNLKNLIKQIDISDIFFLGGFIKRSEVFREILKSDLPIHIGENLNYPTIAFKVWDYLSCKKKILYIGREDSFTAHFLKKNDFGITIPIENLYKAKLILKNLLNELNHNKFDTSIDENLLNEYSWDNIAIEFIDKVLKNII